MSHLQSSESKKSKAPRSRKHLVTIGILSVTGALILGNAANFGIQTLVRSQQAHEDIGLAAADVGRDLGYGTLMAMAENLYYQVINPAAVGGKPTAGAVFGKVVPSSTGSGQPTASPAPVATTDANGAVPLANYSAWGAAVSESVAPANIASPAKNPVSQEGVWQPTKIVVDGKVAIRIARVRPDAIHTSFLDTLIWMDPKLLAFQEIPGTLEPKGQYDHGTGQVPKVLKAFYVAGINGGYKSVNMHGGFIYKGQTITPMRDNTATLVTYPDGHLDVVNWGKDLVTPGFISARQNLPMLVEDGKNRVTNNNDSQWGNSAWGTASGANFVWRSAIGVRADGTVLHLVGPSMSQSDLADLMIRAGAVRAMCLDMNNGWASSFLYGPYGSGVPVDPQITRTSRRFLDVSTRDFLAVYAKSPAKAAIAKPHN